MQVAAASADKPKRDRKKRAHRKPNPNKPLTVREMRRLSWWTDRAAEGQGVACDGAIAFACMHACGVLMVRELLPLSGSLQKLILDSAIHSFNYYFLFGST